MDQINQYGREAMKIESLDLKLKHKLTLASDSD
jgi:hypothetical protein